MRKNNIIYFVVYQAGIANVFSVDHNKRGKRERIIQSTFKECEAFGRGLRQAGQICRAAWCNHAGDITAQVWCVTDFENAPFNEKFSSDFVKNGEQVRIG